MVGGYVLGGATRSMPSAMRLPLLWLVELGSYRTRVDNGMHERKNIRKESKMSVGSSSSGWATSSCLSTRMMNSMHGLRSIIHSTSTKCLAAGCRKIIRLVWCGVLFAALSLSSGKTLADQVPSSALPTLAPVLERVMPGLVSVAVEGRSANQTCFPMNC
jgi:hypothetical protein